MMSYIERMRYELEELNGAKKNYGISDLIMKLSSMNQNDAMNGYYKILEACIDLPKEAKGR